jgi:hypothetical protein
MTLGKVWVALLVYAPRSACIIAGACHSDSHSCNALHLPERISRCHATTTRIQKGENPSTNNIALYSSRYLQSSSIPVVLVEGQT